MKENEKAVQGDVVANELVEKYCKGKCKCCIVREDGTIECLNTWCCPYGLVSEPGLGD